MEANRWEEDITLSLLLWPIGEGTQTRERERGREKKSVGPNDDARRTSWKKRTICFAFRRCYTFIPIFSDRLVFPTSQDKLACSITVWHRIRWVLLPLSVDTLEEERSEFGWCQWLVSIIVPVVISLLARTIGATVQVSQREAQLNHLQYTTHWRKISAEDDRSIDRTWLVCHALVCCGRWTN